MFTQVNKESGYLYPDEKRYVPRWEVKNAVTGIIDDKIDMQGETVDLSCAGTCISIDKDLGEVNQQVQLTVYLSETAKVDLQGNIVWAKNVGDKKEVGVKFFNTSSKIQQMILDYSYDVDRTTVVNHWFEGWSDSEE
ncbi:MAG: PilZ domain-containing protein [Candidatus Omnitrophica bacterium]|nr:PilZ domain-containing protein [Candidatus Omnitrophota bacterium]MBU1996337.1 PilZ domain-containing protein [Candidatus Omnitrophota bacterium]MBU4333742.1 PilZ domain-containing protein [Candidatus Omnitrophota bacterium]